MDRDNQYEIDWSFRVVHCDVCGSLARFVHNIEIYGHPVGEWNFAWLCTNKKCGAYIGTKPGTDIPIKRMDTYQTKLARIQAHKVFDTLWKTRYQRIQAYGWLRRQMKLDKNRCHIALFDIDQCREVIRLVETLKPIIPDIPMPENRFERRKIK